MAVSEVQRWKSSIVKSFFIDTADQNYIVARWSFLHGLHRDFFWNAAHGIEKYLKASLLLNDISVREKSHNIDEMYQELQKIASQFLPNLLIQPSEIHIDKFWRTDPRLWSTETCKSYIERLNDLGDPNNRYAYFSYDQRSDDLFKLDAMVFMIRRLCVGLDWDISCAPEVGYRTYRDWLGDDAMFQPRGEFPELPKIKDEVRLQELEEALFRLNFAFEPNPSYLTGFWPRRSATNAWLYLLTETARKDTGAKPDKDRAEVLRWLVENVRFSKKLQIELLSYADQYDPSLTR